MTDTENQKEIKVETRTEDDGTKVYVYHRPILLKRRDENGNRELKYHKIERRYRPKTSRAERRDKFYGIIKSLLDAHPTWKPGEVYHAYIEECMNKNIPEDDQYMLNSFYHIVRKIKSGDVQVPEAKAEAEE